MQTNPRQFVVLYGMSTASGSGSSAVAKATPTEDDWSEIKADVQKIIATVQSLIPQPNAPKLKVSLIILYYRVIYKILDPDFESSYTAPISM